MLDIITKTLALVAAAAILVVILIGFLFPDPAYSCAGSPLAYGGKPGNQVMTWDDYKRAERRQKQNDWIMGERRDPW